jgi:hypothetical protein
MQSITTMLWQCYMQNDGYNGARGLTGRGDSGVVGDSAAAACSWPKLAGIAPSRSFRGPCPPPPSTWALIWDTRLGPRPLLSSSCTAGQECFGRGFSGWGLDGFLTC